MIVAISGSTGFIGRSLAGKMQQLGWTVRVIDRDSVAMPDQEFLQKKIEGADAVINLAGAPVAKKWTESYKQEILASRLGVTQKISAAIRLSETKPAVFISASGTGIYDSINTHVESSTGFSESFLARVCREWENAALMAEGYTRVVIFRLGMVLGHDGGALEKLHFPFSIGLGGKIGKGTQPVSFIHIDDLFEVLMFVIANPEIQGIVNAVAPYPSDNAEFTDKLGKVLDQPSWFTVPAFALKMMYGEGAQVMLDGQRVMPEKLLQAGFRFKYPTIQNALVNIYG